MNVRGKTILVTGASRGIGRSLAIHFAGKGANLALLDVNAEDVSETRSRCTQPGIEARSYIADAANEDSVVGALDQVTADFGALDGLINNAGAGGLGALAATTADGLEKTIRLNIVALTRLSRAALVQLKRQGAGVLINIGSVLAHAPSPRGAPIHGRRNPCRECPRLCR